MTCRALQAAACLILATACSTAGRRVEARVPAPEPAHIGTFIPDSIGRFKLVGTETYDDAEAGTLYRYSDGSSTRFTAFIYPVGDDVRVGDESEWVRLESEKLARVLESYRHEGRISDGGMVASSPRFLVVRGDTIRGMFSGGGTRIGRMVSAEFQYLYVADNTFIKVRITTPQDRLRERDVHFVAQTFVGMVVSRGNP